MQGATSSRVFGACRALLASAKPSASATVSKVKAPKTPATTETKPKPKATGSTTKAPSGIQKPVPVSQELSDFVGGAREISRADVTKKIWAHIKEHNLQNPANKREIICDEKLKVLFDGRDNVTMLEIAKLTSRHFLKFG